MINGICKKFSKGSLIAASIILSSTSLYSCNKPENLEVVCSRDLIKFQNELKFVLNDVNNNNKNEIIIDETDRNIASDINSIFNNNSDKHTLKDDYDNWLEWSEDKLKTTQSYIDITDLNENQKETRTELSKIADELVLFHGYATNEDPKSMKVSLKKMILKTEFIEDQYCK